MTRGSNQSLQSKDVEKDQLSLEEDPMDLFMKLLNIQRDQQKYSTLEILLMQGCSVDLKAVYAICARLIRILSNIIHKEAMIFKPFGSATPLVIRIFEDNGLGFVPCDEMGLATGDTWEPQTSGIWKTMSAERALLLSHTRLLFPVKVCVSARPY